MNILRTGILLCLLTITCSFLNAQCSTTTVSNNLLINGDFEITSEFAPPMVAWTTFGAAYQTPFPPQFATYQNSLGSAMTEGYFFSGVSGFFQDAPMMPGSEITAGMWISHSSCNPLGGQDNAFVSLEFYDQFNNSLLVVTSPPVDAFTTPDIFELSQVTAVAPLDVAYVRIVGVHVHEGLTGAVNFDDAFLVLGDGVADIQEIIETELPVMDCEVTTGDNLVSTNATFDIDLSDWNQFTEFNTGFNIQYDPVNQYASIFGGFTFPVSNQAAISYANPAPAAEGDRFQACMDLSSITGDFINSDNFAFVELQWLDGGGAIISTEISARFDRFSAPDAPLTLCVKGTAPAGTASVTIAGVFDQTGCGTGSVKYDNAALHALEPIGAEFQLGTGACDVMVTAADLPVPCATDNCGLLSVTSDFVDGVYPIGVYTVNWTAVDVNGNISECSYDFEVAELDETTGMSCNDNIFGSLDENCEFEVTVDGILEGNDYGCYDDFTITTSAGTTILTEPGTYGVTVTNEIGNACWSTIHLEDKLKPTIECQCPPGAWMTTPACQIDCDRAFLFVEGRRGEPMVFDNCQDVEPFFGGATVEETDCGEYLIRQIWGVQDEDGNLVPGVSCVNEFYVTTPPLEEELECPEDVVYDCTDPVDDSYFHPDQTGYPKFGREKLDGASNAFCNISAGFEDLEIYPCGDECLSSVKVLRTWNIIDWCTLETETCNQVIKVSDDTPPTLIMDDVTVSTSPWSCSTDIWFDDPLVHDDCDDNPDWFISYSNSGATLVDEDGRSGPNAGPLKHALEVPKGDWIFVFSSVDCCGNIANTTVMVHVIDKTPPVPVAVENVIVSLTSSGDDWDGTGKITVESIDNGSHDNCSNVWIELRRDEDLCDLDGNMTYSDRLPGYCDPWYDNDDTDDGQFVKFCCEDLMEVDQDGTPFGLVKVFMRVWDDGNMDGIYGSYTYHDNPGNDHDYCEIHDNYNEIWVYVRVEDKSPVVVLCPPDITIPCDWAYTDTSITGVAIASGNCDHPTPEFTDWPDLHCGAGYVIREWGVPGEDYVCVQRITIEPVEEELDVVCPTYLDFQGETWFDPFNPNHVAVDCGNFEFPEAYNNGGACSLVGVNETVDTFWFEQDACYKAIKTWNFVDWCTGEEATCEFVVSLVDSEAPEVVCQDTCYTVNDHWDSDNDGNFCEMTSDVFANSFAMDSGECGSEWIKWVAELDLWGDGTVDITYSSFISHTSKYYVAPTMSGTTVSIRLDKDDISSQWARHIIEWKAFDGCGNVDRCFQAVEVFDKIAPTPYCVGISTALMTPETGNLVEIWAKDFNLGSYDNCSESDRLGYTFFEVSPVEELKDEIHCFRPVWVNKDLCVPMLDPETGAIVSEEVNNCNGYEDGAQNPECPLDAVQKWDPTGFDDDGNTCFSAGVKFKGIDWCGENVIKVSVWDEHWNTEYCSVNLIVHGVNCVGGVTEGRIAGIISTETGSTVDEVRVKNSSPLISGGSTNRFTEEDGFFSFDDNVLGGDYAITAQKTNDFINGVSTFDLVLIQKHILGLTAFDSGYKMVAADINNDASVSAVDLVELRKLILGIYPELPSNESWRFIDQDQTLNVANPWPINEEVNISNLSSDMMANDFVAVKIGDVNGNVTANLNDINQEERIDLTVELETEIQPNGTILVRSANAIAGLYGYQFTAQVEGNLTGVSARAIAIDDSNFGVFGNGIITTSFSSEKALGFDKGELLFVLEGVSSIQMIEGVTKAEAYVGNGDGISLGQIALTNSTQIQTFELAQNEPNPFSDVTNITFTIPTKSEVSFKILDLNGQLMKQEIKEYEKGTHQIQVDRSSLGANGVLYYQLDSGANRATRKMIVID